MHRTAIHLLATALLAVAPLAHAAERVTLRTGFSIVCVSKEAQADGTVRLHLTGSADNFMDVKADSIVASETVPDEPVVATPEVAAVKPQGSTELKTIFADAGQRHNVNVALLAAVAQAESGGNAHAVSKVGAQGVMQLMPGTARELGVADSFSAEGNVNGGSLYLDRLLTRYHENLALALAAYNAGPGAVDKYHGIPPYRETQRYVAKVIREFNRRVLAESQHATAVLTPAR